MLTVCTLLWSPNAHSKGFSSMYSEEWVEKLYRGFARNLTRPFVFVCYTDRPRTFAEPIHQLPIRSPEPAYADCIQPFELGQPMILVGLDTVVCGNIDHLADYCLSADVMALPVDPYAKGPGGSRIACNGVCLVPAGYGRVWSEWTNEPDDMAWVRRYPHVYIDDVFPGAVRSYKGHVEKHGLGDTRVCYFHGLRKPHELPHVGWVQEHWR